MAAMPLPRLLTALPLADVPPVDVSALSLSSGGTTPGALFVAVAGLSRHGLEFVDEALERGAAAVLAEPAPEDVLARARALCAARAVPLLLLENLPQRISALASRFYSDPSSRLRVIGITGTDGKTSVSQFIAQALGEPQAPCGVVGTLGYGLLDALDPASHTTPDAIRVQQLLASLVEKGAAHVAMEVSSHALDQGRVAGVRFSVAVLTNLTRDHLDYHGTVEAYADAKARLFHMEGVGCAVINRDDAFGRRLERELAGKVPVFGYSLDAEDSLAAVRATQLALDSRGMRLRVCCGQETAELVLPLLGRFNAANVLATLTTLIALGQPFAEAAMRVGRLQPVAGRMERVGGDEGPLVIVDYAHTPAALTAALTAARAHARGRLWCVFGCGGERDKGKRPQMGSVAARLADEIVLTDDNPRGEDPQSIIDDILLGCEGRQVTVARDRAEAIRFAVSRAVAGDAVLIAGKGHEQEQIVAGQRMPFDDRQVAASALREVRACSR